MPDNEIATSYADEPGREREAADVKRWMQRIGQARAFDEPARKQYAIDRRYARGDSGFDVDANIAGTNIDILESFYYAKDPDIDVMPADAVEPPPIDVIREAALQQVQADPMTMMLAQQAEQAGAMLGLPGGGEVAMQQAVEAKVVEFQEAFARRSRETKAYARTLEVITSRLWRDASLKRRGRSFVRTALTVGMGVLKSSWQERTSPSPETQQAINDLQRDIAQLKAKEIDLAENPDDEAMLADYERKIARLESQPEPVISRGFVADVVTPENFQVAPGVTIANYVDAPWIAERIPMRLEDAKADFALTTQQASQCNKFKARKPEMGKSSTPGVDGDSVDAKDADAYVTTETGLASIDGESEDFVMVWEIWDRDGGSVLTGIEGCPYWVKAAWTPTATTRFYPFFVFCVSEVEGQRHPQSLVSRTRKLLDAFNRTMSNEREHLSRIIPQMMFNEEQIAPKSVKKLTAGIRGEWIGVSTTGQAPLTDLIREKPYPLFNPLIYDTSRLSDQIERLWGVQEALSGAISVAKTATEAEIQQSGFQARTGGRRDFLETQLGEMAQYTAEVARANVTLEDAQKLAGPDAFWPEYEGTADLSSMVKVEIRAGSTGKPNTTAERDAWAVTLPLLQAGVVQLAQLRNSAPEDLAASIEELMRITITRSGDRLDVEQLLPKPGPALPAAMPGAPVGTEQPLEGGIPA